ncbi:MULTISPECIES: ribosomal protection-like ABC-F family protein [unclassified Nitratiruptor]|uniref:ribosomal protection-like ABC-F family protein n=1 Tax=unclassified Nitratiruptor TaxID=2624044 RepID=UPI0019169D1A|nr:MULTISPECIES: ABC-F family ATP-binding cassette domain-containing protein [unclassified Nitratiruptor]BCD60246.1 ABC transport system ATP-binding/permease protein [Nitratiruptor sp. YY08-10]BCD64265.1 ABC transport system ATP-binding/permease protein [Nitratiruptor sp. YY08-14]
MALIDLAQIKKNYEAQKILCGVDFTIDEGERVAIVGKNGSGKSTLMKIVAGLEDFDEGERKVRQNLQIRMLPQVPKFDPTLTVKEAILDQLKEINEAKKRYEQVSIQIAENPENTALLEELNALSNFLDYHNAWNMEEKIERVLQEFNLKMYEDRLVTSLSGGEQRRVALAGLLLQKPDILLLDEPTNHLDVYMVSFLEEMIAKEHYTMLFVSHDRYFIDNIATRVVEVEDCKLRSFKGGYSSYLEQKEELLKNLQKQHENLLRLLKQEEEWLRRGVKARVKRNEGRKKRVLELREKAKKNPALIKKVQMQLEREKKHFNREDGISKKKVLFELEHVTKYAGEKLLIKDFSTRILQRDTIAIVGKNGTGKSTFLQLLLGQTKPDSGVIKRGEFTIGYFDQHRTMLDDEKNLIETFCPNGGDRVEVWGKSMHVYGYLKNFLFPKEFLDKKIGSLSGGEKNRVALALLFTKKVDCLILDEPTNDLDIPTINILEENLQKFPGAVIFVSHDRYFVDKIAKKLFIFKGNGIVEESYQSYSEYLEIEKEIHELETLEKAIHATQEKPIRVRQRKEKLSYKEQKRLEELPSLIEYLEEEIAQISECLSNPECYEKEGIVAISQKLAELENEHEKLLEEYLELEEKRERIEGMQ